MTSKEDDKQELDLLTRKQASLGRSLLTWRNKDAAS